MSAPRRHSGRIGSRAPTIHSTDVQSPAPTGRSARSTSHAPTRRSARIACRPNSSATTHDTASAMSDTTLPSDDRIGLISDSDLEVMDEVAAFISLHEAAMEPQSGKGDATDDPSAIFCPRTHIGATGSSFRRLDPSGMTRPVPTLPLDNDRTGDTPHFSDTAIVCEAHQLLSLWRSGDNDGMNPEVLRATDQLLSRMGERMVEYKAKEHAEKEEAARTLLSLRKGEYSDQH